MLLFSNPLLLTLAIPLIGFAILIFLSDEKHVKIGTIFITLLTFFSSIYMWVLFDNFESHFQFFYNVSWIVNTNIGLTLGIDGISLLFVVLTTFLVPLCLIASYTSINDNSKEYYLTFLALEILLLLVFSALNLLFFYVVFEAVLIPMFVLIGFWGSRERRVRASFFLFLYTLIGSILMLIAIIYLFVLYGTLDYNFLLTQNIPLYTQQLCWVGFFASFASKLPMMPVHIWLPEAHVEAPTAGSVILAGVLLKLGSYGILRFSLPLFPLASAFFAPLVCSVAVLGIIYCSLTAIRQTDIKRVIAYASIAHMNLIVLGMFSFTIEGIEGSLIQMLSHGIVSSALFLCIGILYDRYHTRTINYYSGLASRMPIFTSIFFLYILANIALPGTSSFVGELLILSGTFFYSSTLAILGATGMVLGGIYSLWLFNRIAFGNTQSTFLKTYKDVTFYEMLIQAPLIFLTLFMGICPNIFLSTYHESVVGLVLTVQLAIF
jgi:NADH-quinone oxidoreductase subunit M